MATRIKRITGITSGPTNFSYTVPTQPSTAGDIVTRVLIDRITLDGLSANFTFYMFCGSLVVAWVYTGWSNTQGTVILSGSDSINNFTAQGSPYVPVGYAGTGSSNGTSGGASWTIPSQFYSSVGESIVLQWQGQSVQMRFSFICIGEY